MKVTGEVCNEIKKRGKFTARGLKDLCQFCIVRNKKNCENLQITKE